MLILLLPLSDWQASEKSKARYESNSGAFMDFKMVRAFSVSYLCAAAAAAAAPPLAHLVKASSGVM